jgi:hypothetical protein|tara:strand:- start:544 stop:873 length:330 start_codon:yes stop_codon:yes gene_type:complete
MVNCVLNVARVALSNLLLKDIYNNMIGIVFEDCGEVREMNEVHDILSRELDMIPQEYRDIIDSTMRQLTKEDNAVRVIQNQWHSAISDPMRMICRTRLLTEFEELVHVC